MVVERLARLVRNPVVVIGAVTILAGVLRFSGLSNPRELVFDETYYAKDACIYLSAPPSVCGLESDAEQSWVHPPLGKWMIAAGEAAFGHRVAPPRQPFGWRVSGAVTGTLTVTLVALLALVLTRSVLWAGAAGLLLATESLHFVQSRTAMLDVHLAFFVVAAFLFLALDRRWLERRDAELARAPAAEPGEDAAEPRQSLGPGAMAAQETEVEHDVGGPPDVASPVIRPWRLASGLALGAGAAVKWSALLALAGAAALSAAWEVGRRRRAFRPRPIRETLVRESFGWMLAFVFAPLLVYFASYAVWLKQHGLNLTEPPWDSLRQWWDNQVNMWGFHRDLETIKENGEPIHPYMSQAWTWFLLKRPVAYFYQGTETTAAEIIGLGNPAVFWGAVLAVPYVLVRWVRGRDWTAGLVAVAVLAQYVPWLFVPRPAFLFYMTPVVPFMVLAVVLALRGLAGIRVSTGARPFAPVAGLFVAVAVILFAFFHPVLVGKVIEMEAWRMRMWFGSWV